MANWNRLDFGLMEYRGQRRGERWEGRVRFCTSTSGAEMGNPFWEGYRGWVRPGIVAEKKWGHEQS